jgi:hypothetical protein
LQLLWCGGKIKRRAAHLRHDGIAPGIHSRY